MDGIYVIIRKYASSEGTPENHYEDDGYQDWTYKPDDHNNIYHKMMEVTDGDHEISCEAASWCKTASVGKRYEFREGEVEIVEIN